MAAAPTGRKKQIEEAMTNHWVAAGADQASPGAGGAAAAAVAPPEAAPAPAPATEVEALRAEVCEQRAEVDKLRQQVAALQDIVCGGGHPGWQAVRWQGPWQARTEEADAKPEGAPRGP